jgi:tetratricopeptide (TPR) repeat protein
VVKAVRRISIACVSILLLAAGLCRAQQAKVPASAVSKATGPQIVAAVQQALTLEQQAKFPEAEAAWKRVVKLQPENAQAYAHLGLLEARQEHYPQAILHYRKAQALAESQNKPIPQLNLNLGLALFKAENFEDAARVFETELKKHPSPADALRLTNLAAVSYYGAHQYAAAIPYLQAAANAEPRNLELKLTLAHCYLWTNQLDAVKEVDKEILTIDPDSAEADILAGEALDEMGDKEGAVAQFRAAEKVNPRAPNLHFLLAYVLWTQKRYDEALPEFKAELEVDPKNNQAMIYLGDLYVRQGQYPQAKEVLERAAQFPTSDPELYLDLGIVSMETGDNENAVQELSKAAQIEPDNVTVHFRLATLYRTMGKKDEAKAEFALANSLNKKRDDSVRDRITAANAHPDGKAAAAPPKPDGAAKPDQP